METAKKSKGKYWILFLISIAAFFGVYAVGGGYCSTATFWFRLFRKSKEATAGAAASLLLA